MPPTTSPQRDWSAFHAYFGELGKHPVRAGDGLWFESGPSFFQSFPFHVVHRAGNVPLRELFRHRRVLAARYARAPGDAEVCASRSALWIRREHYTLDQLSSNSRSKIRRGLKNTRVERVDFDALRDAALPLIASTAARQRVGFGSRQAAAWHRTCDISRRHPVAEAWGGFVGDNLAVFAVCFQVADCFQISTVRSDSDLLGKYPNNALIHSLLEEGFKREGTTAVCYGLASLDRSTAGLNDFKRSAGFEADPVDDVIVGRLPIFAAKAGGSVLDKVSTRSHRLAQLATTTRTMSWWPREEARRPTGVS